MDQGVLQAAHSQQPKLEGREENAANILNEKETHARTLKAIGVLASGIVHEINTPIQYTSDNVRFLQEAIEEFVVALKAYEEIFDNLPPDIKDKVGEIGSSPLIKKEELVLIGLFILLGYLLLYGL